MILAYIFEVFIERSAQQLFNYKKTQQHQKHLEKCTLWSIDSQEKKLVKLAPTDVRF